MKFTRENVLCIYEILTKTTGGTVGVRDEGLLLSALEAPYQTFGGVELFPTILEKAVRLGYGLVANHPFIDGNGRTGRLLLNLDLIQNGYPAINVKFTDRKKYYAAFDEFYRNNNAEMMITLVADYVIERLEQYLEILD